jgi:tripartite-type tricarboxylate transporter receptor subunit TctC
MGPKGIPKPIVQRIQEAAKKATEEPEFTEALKKLDMAILYQTTEEYEKFVRQDFESIGKVVKALGLDKK